MTHDDNVRRSSSRPPSGSGPNGHHSSPPVDTAADGGEQPETHDPSGVGENFSGTGRIDASGAVAKREDSRPDAVAPEVHDAEPVTRGELTEVLSMFWAGPTPSPDTLAAFAAIHPSFAERAFAMSEQSVAASNEEKLTLAHGDVDAIKRGQYLTFALSIVCFFAAGGLYWMSQNPWLSGLTLSPPVLQYFGKMVRTVREGDSRKAE